MIKTKRGHFISTIGNETKQQLSWAKVLKEREYSRLRAVSLYHKLKNKSNLNSKEQEIFNSLQNISKPKEFNIKTSFIRKLAVNGTIDPLKKGWVNKLISSKEISHPQNPSFTKRIKYLNKAGHLRLNVLKKNLPFLLLLNMLMKDIKKEYPHFLNLLQLINYLKNGEYILGLTPLEYIWMNGDNDLEERYQQILELIRASINGDIEIMGA